MVLLFTKHYQLRISDTIVHTLSNYVFHFHWRLHYRITRWFSKVFITLGFELWNYILSFFITIFNIFFLRHELFDPIRTQLIWQLALYGHLFCTTCRRVISSLIHDLLSLSLYLATVLKCTERTVVWLTAISINLPCILSMISGARHKRVSN